jgi:phage baseplate assembly protein W
VTGAGTVLGRGIAFPPRIGADGRWAWSEGEPNIREAIQVIVLTEPGERLQLPDFGGGLGALLFEPNTTTARHQLGERIRGAIADWEPRVTVQSVAVDPDPADPEAAVATVTYQLVATQAVASVALPVELRG